jgi:hypothetical protein
MPMPIVKLAPNVPLKMKAKFCDIVPGQYGHQIRLKGLVDGEESLVYLPGPVWKNLKALRSAGAINSDEAVNEEPEKALAISLLEHELELVNEQKAGEKFPSIVVKAGTNGKPPVSEVENVGRLPNDPPEGATEVEPTELDKLLSLHARLYKHVLAHYVQAALEAGVEVDLSGVSALTAQLFIPASKL